MNTAQTLDFSKSPAIGIAIDRLLAEGAGVAKQLFEATVNVRMFGVYYSRGDTLNAARHLRSAVDTEIDLTGDCVATNDLLENLREEHTGERGTEDCGVEHCAICAAINGMESS